ncbi:MAG TPA: NUDIX domain-containing protein [Rickettsiales bacterium]|nr:NUDIX domain-containing protein [Rickettsiales bacterium]
MSNNRQVLTGDVHIFIIKNNQILLLKRYNTGWEDGKYHLPAGHKEADETFKQAVIRETMEEIGLKIIEEDLEFIHFMHSKTNNERAAMFFLAKQWTEQPINKEPNKCSGLEWFNLNELPDNMVEYAKIAINNFIKKIYYSEYGWK